MYVLNVYIQRSSKVIDYKIDGMIKNPCIVISRNIFTISNNSIDGFWVNFVHYLIFHRY